jgi:hypothetical protein
LVAVVALVRLLIRTADHFSFAVRCPYEIEYGEGVLLQYALNIARGGQVFGDYHHYPYVAATYPPFYPLLAAAGVKVFGVTLVFGRVLSVLATLGIVMLMWMMVRRSAQRSGGAVYAVLFFIAAPIVCWWGPVMRVDVLAVFLGVAGLYCVMRGGRWLIPAVALMALAVYTRQSNLAPLAASVAYLWWVGERRNAALVAASWCVLVIGAFAVLQAASHGWFYQHVVVANRNLWQMSQLVELCATALPAWPAPFLVGLVGAGFALAGARGRTSAPRQDAGAHPARLLGLYFVFAIAVTLTAGKVGASVNYLVEPLAASCLVTGIAYDRLAARTGSWAGKAAWVALCLLAAAVPMRLIIDPGVEQYMPYRSSRADIMRGGKAAVAMIRSARGDVLSEDTGLLPISGKPVVLDPHKMTSLFHDGEWDQRPLLRDIAARKFALIITRWDPEGGATDKWGAYGTYRWSIGMGRAIMRNYYLVKHVGFLYITAPADGKHPTCAQVYLRRRQQSQSKL